MTEGFESNGCPVIVALDMGRSEALDLAQKLQGTVKWVKVGMTLYYLCGPAIVRELREMGFDVFLDLKLNDIPHQVLGAASSVTLTGAQMLTVHASGGVEMMRSAVEGASATAELAGIEKPIVLAITVLTSMDEATLRSLGIEGSLEEQVDRLAHLAKEAGVDGVVCSPLEAARMRALLGPDAAIVTPGVRPAWASADDQSRIMTPAQACAAGASHLVIGRPITAASDPLEAAVTINKEIEG